jgi:hypothetical protein
MSANSDAIISLYDGVRSSVEIANILGLSARYVRRIATVNDLPRLHCGAQPDSKNHQYVCGRRIDHDGYALVTAPKGHPFARKVKNRSGSIIFEHRLVMERKLGRYLLPEEVVDHIDGLTLHNDPDNLRIFPKNGDHLHETIIGLPKLISVSGKKNIALRFHPDVNRKPVDIYYRRRERGDVQLLQTLLAALKFGIDSPFLSGTHRHLEKIGIDWNSHSSLEHALDDLWKRWEADLLQ